MNPALQAAFDSVRDALAGRIDDEGQLRELAVRIADESVELRRRIELAVGYARRGLRLEACSEAEASPSVHVLAVAFATDDMRRWDELCASRGLPRPEFPSDQAIGEIDEAIALTAPLRGRLSLMRRLVLSDASAWSRLEVLRDLVARDPENPAWAEDRDELELVAAAELNARIDQDILLGDLRHAETCVERLEDGKWSQPIAGRLGAQCRRKLGAAQAQQATVDAATLVQQIEAEWAAENDHAAREALLAWDRLSRRVAECGGTMPPDLAQRAAAAAAWLSDRDAHADARRVNAELVDALDRAARDERIGLEELRRSLRAAEQGMEGVPDGVREVAEARIAELERAQRFRRFARAAGAVAAVGAVAFLAYWWIGESRERAEVERAFAAGRATIPAEDAVKEGAEWDAALERAEAALAALKADERMQERPELQSLIDKLTDLKADLAEERAEVDRLLAGAGDASSEAARPELLGRALSKRLSATQATRIKDWQVAHARAVADRRRAKIDALAGRARELRSQVASSSGADAAGLAAQVSSWRASLAVLRHDAAGTAEVDAELDLCETAIRNAETAAETARVSGAREARLAALPALAAQPAELAAALERFAKDHPEAEQSSDFRRAAGSRARWEALLAWRGLPSEPRAASEQARLAAADAALGGYGRAFPGGPLAEPCAALGRLLVPSASWRQSLQKAIDQPRFEWWSVDDVDPDGTRRHILTATDPSEAPSHRTPSGELRHSVKDVEGPRRVVNLAAAKVARVPEHALVVALRPLARGTDSSANEALAALAAVRTIAAATGADPAERAAMLLAVLREMAAGMPAPLADPARAAADAIERARAADAGSKREDGRPESGATVAALAALRPEPWERAWDTSLVAASAPLRPTYSAAGIVLRAGPSGEVRLDPAVAPGTRLCALGADGAPMRIGSVGPARTFLPEAGVALAALPSGTPVFAVTGGAP